MRWKNVIFVALLVLSTSCTPKPERSLIGEWKGTVSSGQTLSFVFNSDRTFTTVQGSLVVDGSMFGGKIEWRADTSRYPMTLDLIVTRPDGKRMVVPMIFRFITSEKIQIRISEDGQSHPAGFSADDTETEGVFEKQSTAAVTIAQPQPPRDQPGERKFTEIAPRLQSPTVSQRDEFRDEPHTLYATIRQGVTANIGGRSVDLKPGDLVLVIARNSGLARVEINGQTTTIPLSVTDLAQQ